MMPKLPHVLIAACVLLLSSLLVAAESTEAIKAHAIQLIEQGRVDDGYALLAPHVAAQPDDIQAAFVLGQAALLLNRPAEAVEHFQAILARHPDLSRVRAELGRAYAAMGDLPKARATFEQILAREPPPAVGDNIRKFMATLESRKPWNARVSLGYLYDSNVNAGPTSNSVLMFGLPFQLDTSARAQSDSGYNFMASAGYLLPLTASLALQADLQLGGTRYQRLSDFDSNSLTLSLGPTFQIGRTVLALPLLYERMEVDGDAYSEAVGFAPQLRVNVSPALSLTAAWVGQTKDYDVNAGVRNGRLWSASAGMRYQFGMTEFLQASVRQGGERTRQRALDNDSLGLSLGYFLAFGNGLSLYVAPGVTRSDYAAREFVFDRPRRDRQSSLVLNLSKEFGPRGLAAALGFNLTRNKSNLAMYDYLRKQVTLQLSMPF
jgi:tetratricopeptide (TPR) repeat protein